MLFCLESIIIPRYFVTSNWKLCLTSGSRLKYSSVALWLIASYDFAILICCYFRSSIDCTWVIFTFSQMAVWQPGRIILTAGVLSDKGFVNVWKAIKIIIDTYLLLFFQRSNGCQIGFCLFNIFNYYIFLKAQWPPDWLLPKPHPKLKGNKIDDWMKKLKKEKREECKRFAPST